MYVLGSIEDLAEVMEELFDGMEGLRNALSAIQLCQHHVAWLAHTLLTFGNCATDREIFSACNNEGDEGVHVQVGALAGGKWSVW